MWRCATFSIVRRWPGSSSGYGSVWPTIVLTTRVCLSSRLLPRIMSAFRGCSFGRAICTISLVIAATNIAVERDLYAHLLYGAGLSHHSVGGAPGGATLCVGNAPEYWLRW